MKNGINQGSLIRLWNADGKEARAFALPERADVVSLAFSPEGKTLAGGGNTYTSDATTNTVSGNRIYLWNTQSGELLQTIKSGTMQENKLAFSHDGQLLASANASDEKSVEVWDTRTGKQLHTFIGHGRRVQELEFSPDGSTLASGDSAGVIKLWRVR